MYFSTSNVKQRSTLIGFLTIYVLLYGHTLCTFRKSSTSNVIDRNTIGFLTMHFYMGDTFGTLRYFSIPNVMQKSTTIGLQRIHFNIL